MALTKITSRILDSSGITILGTIATGVWQGTAINQTYLVGQSGTNTGDETLARINALDVTELGTISSGVWNGTVIASAYLDADTAHLSTTQTFTGAKTFSNSVAVGGWIIPNGVNALTADSSHTYLQQPSGGDILLRKSDGTSFVTITNGGNVGVGTATPFGVTSNRTSLSVNGTTSSVVNIGTGNAQRGWFYAESDKVLLNTAGAIPLILGTNNVNYLTIASGGATTLNMAYTGGSTGMLNLVSTGSESGMVIKNSSGDGFKVGASGTSFFIYDEESNHQPLTILTNGNVGIGTTSPGSYYSGADNLVVKQASGEGGISIVTATNTTGGLYFADGVTGNELYRGGITYDHNSDKLYLTSGGSQKLTISSGGLTQINSTNTTALELITNQSASSLRLKNTGSIVADWIMQSGGITAGDLAFYNLDTSAYRLTISSGGNVGIGTASPTAKLQVGSDWTINSSFGGSALFIKAGSPIDDGDPRIVNTSDIGLIITGNSTNTSGPNEVGLALHNDDTTAGAFSPMLLFTKRESGTSPYKATMAGIWAEAPTGTGNGGSWIDGQLHFGTSGAATAGVVSNMVITPNGYVKKPKQPAFKAGRNGSISLAAGATIVFNEHTTSNHFNQGGHYNNTNGRFTAPIAGVYIFSTVVIFEGLSNNQVMTDSFYIEKNTTTVAYSFRRANYVSSTTGTGGYYVDHASTMLKLAANDYVYVKNSRALAVHGNTNYCYFYGYLLG
jgi:hypothetical protein